jgi:predicted RNA methylase
VDAVVGLVVDRDPAGLAFDRQHGTETRWLDLGNYEPAPPEIVEQALDAVPVDPRGRTFVDLGSGKGRVVLLASRRPFARVVGIEHKASLHEVARRNQAAYERSVGVVSPIHLLCGDVADHPLPEGPLVVWLFNPFGADVLRPVIARLRDREVHLVYVYPVARSLVEAAGFGVVAEGGPEGWPWVVLTR